MVPTILARIPIEVKGVGVELSERKGEKERRQFSSRTRKTRVQD